VGPTLGAPVATCNLQTISVFAESQKKTPSPRLSHSVAVNCCWPSPADLFLQAELLSVAIYHTTLRHIFILYNLHMNVASRFCFFNLSWLSFFFNLKMEALISCETSANTYLPALTYIPTGFVVKTKIPYRAHLPRPPQKRLSSAFRVPVYGS
jgi:hypothetical protein